MAPADHGDAVAMIEVLCGILLLTKERARAVLGALVALFNNDFALCEDVIIREADIDHAVALKAHHQLESIRGHALEISGVVIACEGVVCAAIARDRGRKLTGGECVCAFEQEMLKKVRNT